MKKYTILYKKPNSKEWKDDLFKKLFASHEIAEFALSCNNQIIEAKKQGYEFKIKELT